MSECRLIVNGVEMHVNEVRIKTNPDGKSAYGGDLVEFHAKDCTIPTEDVGELLASLMVDVKVDG